MMDPGTNVSGSRPNNGMQKDGDPTAKPHTAYYQLAAYLLIGRSKKYPLKPHIACGHDTIFLLSPEG